MTHGAAWDAARRERYVVLAAAAALILLRSVVPLVHEGFYFDSDQAIIGLMARRLSSLEGFPLFYDGLNYILGVESWIIAPFFWIARPSVAVMRVPLVALNVAAGVWLVVAIGRRLGVRPLVAFAGALPFIMPAPVVASQLLETAGACVEPFVYVLLLWHLRQRGFAFGAVLALGYLHREFTIFALPALVIVEAAGGAVMDGPNLRRAARMAAGFGAVWLAVDAVKIYQAGGSLGLQAVSLAGQMCFAPEELGPRAVTVFTQALPVLYGGMDTRLSNFRMNTDATDGSAIVGWMVGIALVVMLVRLARRWYRVRRIEAGETTFVYLALVGAFTMAVYPLSCNIDPVHQPILRYILLGLLIPIGVFGAFMWGEPSRALRALVPAAFALWAAANLADNIILIRTSAKAPPSNEHRVLADYLVSHQIRYARAIYWDAYAVDFLARERVTVSSVDLVRIPRYQQIVDANEAFAYNLPRVPCSGGPQIASWCIQPPR